MQDLGVDRERLRFHPICSSAKRRITNCAKGAKTMIDAACSATVR